MKPILLPVFFFSFFSLLHAQTKKVFAHYMVCNRSYGGGTMEGYKKDIQDAQAMGVDGFALNEGLWNINYKQNTERIFEAAKELNTHFQLFFSVDQCCGLTWLQIQEMVKLYGHNPNYFTYKGRPFLSAWTGSATKAKDIWINSVLTPLRDSGFAIYFVPFFYTKDYDPTPNYDKVLDNYNESWKYFFDGYFYFGATGLVDSTNQKFSVIAASEAAAKVFHNSERTYMAPVSPMYWGAKQMNAGRRYFEYRGGEGLAHQWKSIINIQKPEWVELVTWNDWDEGTYMSPMNDISKYWPWALRHDTGYYKTHIGYAMLNKYYIDWYKQGKQPPVRQDQLFFFYRTQTLNAVADKDTLGKVSWLYGNTEDKIYITTLLTKPATLIVYSGNSKHVYALAKGIVQTEVLFETGVQKFIVQRKEREVINVQGENIVSHAKYYNYNMFSGCASAKK